MSHNNPHHHRRGGGGGKSKNRNRNRGKRNRKNQSNAAAPPAAPKRADVLAEVVASPDTPPTLSKLLDLIYQIEESKGPQVASRVLPVLTSIASEEPSDAALLLSSRLCDKLSSEAVLAVVAPLLLLPVVEENKGKLSFLLMMVQEATQSPRGFVTRSTVDAILSACFSLLNDDADADADADASIACLLPLLRTLVNLAHSHASAIQPKFRELLDLLVGSDRLSKTAPNAETAIFETLGALPTHLWAAEQDTLHKMIKDLVANFQSTALQVWKDWSALFPLMETITTLLSRAQTFPNHQELCLSLEPNLRFCTQTLMDSSNHTCPQILTFFSIASRMIGALIRGMAPTPPELVLCQLVVELSIARIRQSPNTRDDEMNKLTDIFSALLDPSDELIRITLMLLLPYHKHMLYDTLVQANSEVCFNVFIQRRVFEALVDYTELLESLSADQRSALETLLISVMDQLIGIPDFAHMAPSQEILDALKVCELLANVQTDPDAVELALTVLCRVLTESNLTHLQLLAMQWVCRCSALADSRYVMYTRMCLSSVMQLTCSYDRAVRRAAGDVLVLAYRRKLLPPDMYFPVIQSALPRIYDSEVEVQRTFERLLSIVGILGVATYVQAAEKFVADQLLKEHVIGLRLKQKEEMVHAGTAVHKLGQTGELLLRRVIDFVDGSEKEPREFVSWCLFPTFRSIVPSSPTLFIDQSVSLFWAIWGSAAEVVRDCLKSYVGGPPQTFQELSRLLLNFAKGTVVGADGFVRCHSLINFIGFVERAMYALYETCYSMPALRGGPDLCQFYTTNRTMLRDWIKRLRPPLIYASVYCGGSQDVVMQSFERLPMILIQLAQTNDKLAVLNELNRLMMIACRHLAIMGDECLIHALHGWSLSLAAHHNISDRVFLLWFEPMINIACGRLEAAIQSLQALCSSPSALKLMDAFALDFMLTELNNCFAKLHSWDESSHWYETWERDIVPELSADLQKGVIESQKPSLFSALAKFDQGDYHTASQLLLRHGQAADSNGGSFGETLFKVEALALEFMSTSLSSQHTTSGSALSKAQELLKNCATAINMRHVEGLNPRGSWQLRSVVTLSKCIGILQLAPSAGFEEVRLLSENCSRSTFSNNINWMPLLRVAKFLEVKDGATADAKWDPVLLDLRKFAFRAAEKAGNMNVCEEMLSAISDDDSYSQLFRIRLDKRKGVDVNTCIEGLWTLQKTLADQPRVRAKCLSLVEKWIANSPSESLNLQQLQTVLGLEKDIKSARSCRGNLLKKVTLLLEDSSSAWRKYGNWLQMQADSNFSRIRATGQLRISQDEREKIKVILARDGITMDNGVEAVLGAFTSSCFLNNGSDCSSLDNDTVYVIEDTKANLKEQMSTLSAEAHSQLLELMSLARQRMLAPYFEAFSSFIQCLNFCEVPSNTTTTNVCLHIIDLICQIPVDLGRALLQCQQQMHCSQAWALVIPQLMARLGHAAPLARGAIRSILDRVSAYHPHLLLYPSHVLSSLAGAHGSSRERKQRESRLIIADLRERFPRMVTDTEIVLAELERITLLWDEMWVFHLAKLKKKLPAVIAELKSEAESLMAAAASSGKKRANVLKEVDEAMRSMYSKALAPFLHSFNELSQKTLDGTAKTQREKAFILNYRTSLKFLGHLLESNPFGRDGLAEEWWRLHHTDVSNRYAVSAALMQPVSDLHADMMARGFAVAKVSLQDISPVLCSIRPVMAMPGLQSAASRHDLAAMRGDGSTKESSDAEAMLSNASFVGVGFFHDNVRILSSVNKPKKVTIMGSDGVERSFLLKREDLRLDERISQFLSVCEDLLAREGRKKNWVDSVGLCRHYSVVPIAGDSGLIEWVDNMIPLFELYKYWQHYDSSCNKGEKSAEDYYTKLARRLHAAHPKDGWKDANSKMLRQRRGEWEKEERVLSQTLSDMMKSTPDDLIAREIWVGSVNSTDWLHRWRNFTKTVVAMSAIGYVLGLGDRHLDNILFDLRDGSVLHIDFHVCFERGKKLSVPETVPFRLTPNIRRALGLKGFDAAKGSQSLFVTEMGRVMQAIRKFAGLLAQLLQAFSYDPLIEWERSEQKAALKRSAGKRTSKNSVHRALLGLRDALGAADSAKVTHWQSILNQQGVIGNDPAVLVALLDTGDVDESFGLSFKGQQRNAYATKVVKRVITKMKGLTGPSGGQQTVDEQVMSMTKAATSPTNLAAMFSGWSAWI